MSTNTGKKRTLKVMEKGLAQQVQRGFYHELQQMMNQERVQMSPQQMSMLAKQLKSKSQGSIDIGYIRTVLFPELYSYDIPQPMSILSYCRFTDKQEATINTGTNGNNGSGVILWYPKVTYGPSLFYTCATGTVSIDKLLPMSLVTVLGATGGAKQCLDSTKWKVGCIQQYDYNFQQTALVAAAISVQYVGQLQIESGYFVGGQTYTQGIDSISIDDIENSQFRVLSKPGEGIRLVYFPKDASDYTYYPTKIGMAHNTGNAGANEDTFLLDATASYKVTNSYSINGAPSSNADYKPSTNIQYQNNCPCLAIYWQGLPQGQDVLRIDATRKFNAIPKANIRDIVEVSRPKRQYDSKKTTDVISSMILSVPQLGGHSIKQMDHVSDQIQQFLPNVGHLYQTGLLKDGNMTLQGLSSGLALQQAGLAGPNTTMGRIWEND